MPNRVRIKDIAKLAGVSPGTVDRVLHNRREVNPETRKRILELIGESGYTPNVLARSLATRRNFRIVAVIPEGGSRNPYWDMPLKGILKGAEEAGDYNTSVEILRFDLDNEVSFRSRLDELRASGPDGVVLAPVFRDPAKECASWLRAEGTPLVFIDSRLDGCGEMAAFGQDARSSGYLAARLMCFGLDRESPVLVLKLARPNGIIRHLSEREEGFIEYTRTCGTRQLPGVITLSIDPSAPGEPEAGLDRVLGENPNIGGIFVTSSRASLVAAWLESRRLDRVVLIGYDLTESNRDYLMRGTIDFLLSQQPEEQGYQCIRTLCRKLALKQMPGPVQFSPIDILTRENLPFYTPGTTLNHLNTHP